MNNLFTPAHICVAGLFVFLYIVAKGVDRLTDAIKDFHEDYLRFHGEGEGDERYLV